MTSKIKSSIFGWLCLLVVVLVLAENRAWGIFQLPQPESGKSSPPAPKASRKMPLLGTMMRQATLLPPKSGLKNIAQLSSAHRDILAEIWKGTKPVSTLPARVRQQLADLYLSVAARNPVGSAQAVFNRARARYLLGRGPNPGSSATEFAKRHGIPVHKR